MKEIYATIFNVIITFIIVVVFFCISGFTYSEFEDGLFKLILVFSSLSMGIIFIILGFVQIYILSEKLIEDDEDN